VKDVVNFESPMKGRKYDYRRNLPHIERSGREHFITFDTYLRWELPPAARDIILKHCLHDNGSKMRLHIAVVMPDHVHMIFMPLEDAKGETYSFEEIIGAIKGASSHTVNKALRRRGTVWQDESFDHVIRHAESLEQKIECKAESSQERAGFQARTLSLVMGGEEKIGSTAGGGCATRVWLLTNACKSPTILVNSKFTPTHAHVAPAPSPVKDS